MARTKASSTRIASSTAKAARPRSAKLTPRMSYQARSAPPKTRRRELSPEADAPPRRSPRLSANAAPRAAPVTATRPPAAKLPPAPPPGLREAAEGRRDPPVTRSSAEQVQAKETRNEAPATRSKAKGKAAGSKTGAKRQ